MKYLFLTLLYVSFFAGFFIGIFLLIKPIFAIKMQILFYEKINWRIEPISMKKEIRNTRIMGLSLIIITVACLIYIFL